MLFRGSWYLVLKQVDALSTPPPDLRTEHLSIADFESFRNVAWLNSCRWDRSGGRKQEAQHLIEPVCPGFFVVDCARDAQIFEVNAVFPAAQNEASM